MTANSLGSPQPLGRPEPLGLSPSFGFGDRLGLATPGHVASLRQGGGDIEPIFAQQSIREMTRTGRSATQVMQDALSGAAAAGFTGRQGADADHLKTPDDVDRTAEAGFVFFTIDPSDNVDGQADSYDANALAAKVKALGDEAKWVEAYKNRKIDLPDGTKLVIDDEAVARASVKYAKAVNQAVALARHIDAVMRKKGSPYEIELSVDETPQPTTLAEHFIVAERCLKEGMKLVSLAPRFIGDFEKGVDFKGDLDAFEKSCADHAAIARMLGPYKLSLHSGSDKLAIYPAFARATQGLFHVKTAGTSYLEALRAILRHDVKFFRRIVDFARNRYETDRATYHVSATLENTPPPSDLNDTQLEQRYLERWQDVRGNVGFTEPGRQILHTTFGSVLKDEQLRGPFFQILREHPETYKEVLTDHFARHLKSLRAGM
ncbi:MAG TPA: tagaturonate epimerase family protein [Tepidisphaeraceae bacterium]|nr:tagaturonate epimerase family protein [Tepidisphaeraceae bacterium]